MRLAKEEVSSHGSMSARAITENLIEKGVPRLNSNRLSKLLNMYGEEINIVKAHRKGEYMCIDRDGLVIKDPWSYAAGFFDSNGYVNISDRGEPKVGLVTKGKAGRMHCEQLYKGIGFGTLQLDQKIYEDAEQSQHRVTFLKSEDVAQFLQNIYPNLRIKGDLAKAMITYVNSDNEDTKGKVKKFLQYTNAEGTAKGDKLLTKWDVDRDTVVNWLEEF